MWHAGLLYKLYHQGITGNVWYILYKLYNGLTGAVYWGNQLSDWFPIIIIKQGVRQGGILSPLLYLVYIDGLIKKLRRSGAGSSSLGRYTGTLVLADDVVLIHVADTPQDLNNMLDVTHSYASHWHYSINPTKSAVVTISNVARPRT